MARNGDRGAPAPPSPPSTGLSAGFETAPERTGPQGEPEGTEPGQPQTVRAEEPPDSGGVSKRASVASPGSTRNRHPVRDRMLDALVVVAPRLISGALWLLTRTLRITYLGTAPLFAAWARNERGIMACWHNRVVMMPIPCAEFGARLCIMNSWHRDGEIATRTLARWGIYSVRGSASRGGVRAFLQLVRAFREGYDLAVVPDGPRGPRYVVKLGVLHLARTTGALIYPVSYAASRAWQLRSWDRLMIPQPFARLTYAVAEPLRVPSEATDDDLETLRGELEQRLNDATATAEADVGRRAE